MLDFIAKYWLEFVFGLVAACIVFAIKQYYASKEKLYEKDQEGFKQDIIKTINKDMEEQVKRSDDADAKLEGIITDLSESIKSLNDGIATIQNQMYIDNVQALKAGVLSMQGKIFKGDCRRLLEPNHIITEEEYEDIVADHKSYNGLGGNHIGDSLFLSVMKKWNAQLELSLKEEHDGSRND